MTTQTKLDALMGSIEAYRTAGGREEHWARKDALEAHLSDLLEECARLRADNADLEKVLRDYKANYVLTEAAYESIRAAAQAVVDANNASIVPVDVALWDAVDELREALK